MTHQVLFCVHESLGYINEEISDLGRIFIISIPQAYFWKIQMKIMLIFIRLLRGLNAIMRAQVLALRKLSVVAIVAFRGPQKYQCPCF